MDVRPSLLQVQLLASAVLSARSPVLYWPALCVALSLLGCQSPSQRLLSAAVTDALLTSALAAVEASSAETQEERIAARASILSALASINALLVTLSTKKPDVGEDDAIVLLCNAKAKLLILIEEQDEIEAGETEHGQ